MKIAVMGTGGVGGYFGGRLAAAGVDVTFIARGAHLAALRETGLRIESAEGDAHISPVQATDDPGDIGPVDIVLFATKLWDVESAGALCRPLLGADTGVISLLNGVDSEDRLIPILGAKHVVGGIAYISAAIGAPGSIQHYAIPPAIAYGELDGRRSARLDAFHATVTEAGIDGRYSETIRDLLWRKFVLLAAMSGITGLTRQPIGPIREDADMRRLYRDAAEEVVQVAAAIGIDIADQTDATMAMADAAQPHTQASMLTDLQRGNRLELEWLSGAVVRLGRAHGVETPVHRVVNAALGPWADGSIAPEHGGPAP